MSRRPPTTPEEELSRAVGRMAPGGRMWSESPIPRYAIRKIRATGVAPVVERRGIGIGGPTLSGGRCDLDFWIAAGEGVDTDTLLYVAIGRDSIWTPPAGVTVLLEGSYGYLCWQVAYGTVGTMGQYLTRTVVGSAGGAGKAKVMIALYTGGTPTSAAVASTGTGESGLWPEQGGLTGFVSAMASTIAGAKAKYVLDPADVAGPDFLIGTDQDSQWNMQMAVPINGWTVTPGFTVGNYTTEVGTTTAQMVTITWAFS